MADSERYHIFYISFFSLLFTYQDSINQHLPQRFADLSIAVSALSLNKFQVFCLYNCSAMPLSC